jgi:transcriptional regulator with XRE-family HTH domain
MPANIREIDEAGLKAAMESRGLSRRDVARRAGLAESTVATAMRGGSVTSRSFARIVSALSAVPELSADLVDQLGGHRAG